MYIELSLVFILVATKNWEQAYEFELIEFHTHQNNDWYVRINEITNIDNLPNSNSSHFCYAKTQEKKPMICVNLFV